MASGVIVGLLIGLPVGGILVYEAVWFGVLSGRLTSLYIREECDRLIEAMDSHADPGNDEPEIRRGPLS